MSKLFYCTLNQGRTDNAHIFANSKDDVISFFNSVSTANLTKIKEVVYSKDFLINTSGVRAFSPQPHDQEIKVLFSTDTHTSSLTLRFPKKDLSNQVIESKIKSYLGFKDENILDFMSIVKR